MSLNKILLLTALATALALPACEELPTDDTPAGIVIYDGGHGGGPDGGIRQTRPVLQGEIAPYYGFTSSKGRTEYYYLGEVDADKDGKIPVNKMYFFYDENGKPLFRLSRDGSKVIGWHPIVDTVPTKPGYSPFWKVVRVLVKGTVDDKAIEALTCPAGKSPCGHECANLKSSKKHCGGCDVACKTGEICSNGKCAAIGCESDLGLCGDKCVNLKNDITNCGKCGTVCKTTETCTDGKCAITSCKAGLLSCTDKKTGKSDCYDLTSESKHCGKCQKECKEDTEECIKGRCSTCKGGNTMCGSTCANLQNDLNNCGTCGSRCAADQRCYSGVCSFGACQMDSVCPGDLKCVEGRCADPVSVGIFPLDGLKSKETLDKSLLALQETNILINCPVVDADAKLLKGITNPDLPFPKMQIWYKRLKAFCYLVQGGKQLLGQGTESVAGGKLPATFPKAYFIKQDLTLGSGKPLVSVYARRNLVISNALPGNAAYSPVITGVDLAVDKDYEVKDVTSIAGVEAAVKSKKYTATDQLKKKNPTDAKPTVPILHNLVVRGVIGGCTSDADCANTGGRNDPPLKCSVETGFCSPPFARYGEDCRRDVKECDPKGGPNGTRLACVGLRVRDEYFCFNACDSSKQDSNPDKEIDSRCGSVAGTRCYSLRQTNPARPNGVCIKICNGRAGNQDALLKECESPTCGDGKLDYNETCDDGNRLNGDGCNKYCSLSNFDRCESGNDCKGTNQQCKVPFAGVTANNTYCLPVSKKEKDESAENNKYRTICMEYNYCWPPDIRAAWLGKKEGN